MNISKRIELLINELQLNKNSFSKILEVHNGVTGNIVNERNNPSFSFLAKIMASFDNVNAHWLLTGEGPVLGPTQTEICAPYIEEIEELKIKYKTCKELLIDLKK